MKTREEIEQEYVLKDAERRERFRQERLALNAREDNERGLLDAARNAALAELDDPMLRLITAAKEVARHPHGEFPHWPNDGLSVTGCVQCAEQKALKSAIDYAEQRRAQG
jgi:hypothetical protein